MASIEEVIAASEVRFGTSGARGRVVELTPEVCFAYTLAFLNAVGRPESGRVALGMDLRPSSPMIAQACASAIRHSNLEVVFCGALPTPALAFFAMKQGMPAVMVTGSHIPFDRNGIKFYRPDGEITKADENAIVSSRLPMPERLVVHPLPPVEVAASQAYASRYTDFFPDQALAGLRVGFYEHSSVARDILNKILTTLGAEVHSLGRTDDFVPIDTEAVSEDDVVRAREWARMHSFDAILSTDGDADRPLLGDEKGSWLRGDVVGILCARLVGAQAVVTPVSSNTALEKCGAFPYTLRTRIGSPYVIAGMETALASSTKASVVGFEANGGFLVGSPVELDGRFLSPLPTRDAVLPIIALLVEARRRNVPLSILASDLPARFTASDRLRDFPTADSQRIVESLACSIDLQREWFGDLCGLPVGQDLTDGLRLTFDSGEILHLRPSGNAPELRCYAEADSQERAEKLAMTCLSRVAAKA